MLGRSGHDWLVPQIRVYSSANLHSTNININRELRTHSLTHCCTFTLRGTSAIASLYIPLPFDLSSTICNHYVAFFFQKLHLFRLRCSTSLAIRSLGPYDFIILSYLVLGPEYLSCFFLALYIILPVLVSARFPVRHHFCSGD